MQIFQFSNCCFVKYQNLIWYESPCKNVIWPKVTKINMLIYLHICNILNDHWEVAGWVRFIMYPLRTYCGYTQTMVSVDNEIICRGWQGSCLQGARQCVTFSSQAHGTSGPLTIYCQNWITPITKQMNFILRNRWVAICFWFSKSNINKTESYK